MIQQNQLFVWTLFEHVIAAEKRVLSPGSERLLPYISHRNKRCHWLAFWSWQTGNLWELKIIMTLLCERMSSFAPSCLWCSIFISTTLCCMYWPKGVGVVSAQPSRMFPGSKRGKATVSPTLCLMIGKGTSKSVPCTFQFRSGTSNPRVKLKICHSYLLSASQNHLKTRRVLRRGFHRKQAPPFDLLPQAWSWTPSAVLYALVCD